MSRKKLHLGILNIHLGLCLVCPPTTTMNILIFNDRLDYSDSLHDHQLFLDWLHNMNVYFIGYPLFEAEKVRFATMKLTR